MDSDQFRDAAVSVIDEVIRYYDTVEDRQLVSTVEPGYLKKLLPEGPPIHGEPWSQIQKDIELKIMPGITHWQSPYFMAFFPASSSFPAILGELYSAALTTPAFNWACSPAMTELETIVLDWLAKLLCLPKFFLSTSPGGGVIQGSASEAIVTVMVAARENYLAKLTSDLPESQRDDAVAHLKSKMVALGSETTHSSTQKAAQILGLRYLSIPAPAKDGYALTGANLAKVLAECKTRGLKPFFLTVTLGTTSTCAVDDFASISSVLKEFAPPDEPEEIWVHIDAAYAGAALICPEYHYLTESFSSFHSFDVNLHKWLLTNFDASCLFVRQRKHLINAFSITPSYLRNKFTDSGHVIDYRDWQIPLGRRFRSLKIWFVLRNYGIAGLQAHIRKHVKMGENFAKSIEARSDLFKIVTGPNFALTTFVALSVKGNNNEITRQVLETVNDRGEIFLTPCVISGIYVIRLVSTNLLAEERFLKRAVEVLIEVTEEKRRNELEIR